jgi:hypothetical protein
MNILFTLLILAGVPIQPELPIGVSQESLEITRDSVLIEQHDFILELDLKGSEVKRFIPGEGFHIDNFAYIESMDLIVMVLGKIVNAESRAVKREIRFYDRQDTSWVPGYFKEEPNPYFRQFLPTSDGRLFVNMVGRPDYSSREVLVEVQLVPHADGYAIELEDEGFHSLRSEYEKWPERFKLRWVTSFGGPVFVVNQMQPVLKRYEPGRGNKAGTIVEQEVNLYSDGWIPPYLHKTSATREPYWLHSFSRNAGLYQFEDGFVVGFTTPNQDHTFFSPPGKTGVEEVSEFILNLQRLDPYGAKVGKPEIIPGGYFAGLIDRTAFVIAGEDDEYELIRIDF